MLNEEMNEATLLLNQEIQVVGLMSRFTGRRGVVNKVMADGRTLDVDLQGVGDVFLDVNLVREVQDAPTQLPQEQSLGPDGNSVLPHNRM